MEEIKKIFEQTETPEQFREVLERFFELGKESVRLCDCEFGPHLESKFSFDDHFKNIIDFQL